MVATDRPVIHIKITYFNNVIAQNTLHCLTLTFSGIIMCKYIRAIRYLFLNY